MVFSAYKEYKRWREAWQQELLEEGRQAERARQKRELAQRGLSLDPEAERILFGENDDQS